MAAPITHIVLAEKLFDKYFEGKDKTKFVLGTVFPDIRRLGKISRESTHLGEVEFADVIAEDSFMAGMKFHQFVDLSLDRYVEETDYFSLFPEGDFLTEGGKVFMDRMLYEKVKDWERVKEYFNEVCNEELEFGVSKEIVEEWHRKIVGYISQKPISAEDVDQLIAEPVEVSREIIGVVNGVSNTEKAIEIIEDFYNLFEELV